MDGTAQLVPIEPDAAVDALVAGEVDAIATWPPHADRARRMLGASRVVEVVSELHRERSVLVTREGTHRARRGALVKLVAALADAERLVRERPQEAFQAFRKEFAEVSEEDQSDAWGRIRLGLGLTHELAAVLEQEAAWFRGTGRIDGPPLDVGALLALDVLSEVQEEAVTFVSAPRVARGR